MSKPTAEATYSACRRCGGKMEPGKAMTQSPSGLPDNLCKPGQMADCMKCQACGWSVFV